MLNFYQRKELDRYISEIVGAPFKMVKTAFYMGSVKWKVSVKAEPKTYVKIGSVHISELNKRLTKRTQNGQQL